MLYRFDDFEIDTENFELRRNGTVQHVEPLVFDLICFLSQNPGRVIERSEIIEHIWDGRIVSDATVSSCIKSARKVLGDSGDHQIYIRTVRGRGFQFTGEVRHVPLTKTSANEAICQNNANNLEPSLIILPFQVFGDDAELASIADGLVENLTTILTRVPLLSLVSRTSSFALKEEVISAQQIRQRFGVTYMLEGSLQALAGSARANIQLIETKNGFHLWAQQFDQPQNPDTMINLLHEILPRLETQLVRANFNELRGKSDELSSKQLLIKAVSTLSLKGWHKDSFTEAAGLLRRSIKLEPDLALSHSYLALILGLGHRVGLLQRSGAIVREAVNEAEKALDLDNMDSNVLGLAGCALADVGQPDRAIPLLTQATELNPNNAQAWTALGSARLILGDSETAIKHIRQGIKISPMDSRLAVWWSFLAFAYLQSGEFDQALSAARQGCQNDDKTYLPRVLLTAVHITRKENAEAAKVLRECYRIKPDLSEQEISCLVGRKLGAVFEKIRVQLHQ